MDMKRRPLVVGNWKMNGLTNFIGDLAGILANKVARKKSHPFDMLICPPTTLLHPIGKIITETGLLMGGQDCHTGKSGAHTGDISAEMLKDVGCSYVILGHSERRADHIETDEIVKRKVDAAMDANLISIICVGETASERKNGVTADVVTKQILACVPQNATAESIVVAYEPVWAIGTGENAEISYIEEIHSFIKEELRNKKNSTNGISVVYGGSVNLDNYKEIYSSNMVDGLLIGGASLDSDTFTKIYNMS